MLFLPPLYRAFYFGLKGNDVITRVRKIPKYPCTKTFLYKLNTEALPVKRGSIKNTSVNCRLRAFSEDLERCFNKCKDALLFSDVLQRALKKGYLTVL